MRRERSERDLPGSATGQNRRASPLYFDQPRGSSREREKAREYPGRYQRSISPHYSESPSGRRPGAISGEGYSNSQSSKSFWNRCGPESISSSCSKTRPLSPVDFHPEERDAPRTDSLGRGGRSDGGRNSFAGEDFRGGSFDGHRRVSTMRDSSASASADFPSSGGGHQHPSRERHSAFNDIDYDRGGDIRVGRGAWGSSLGLNRGGFFAGRGCINRFSGYGVEGGGRSHSGFGVVRNFPIQRRPSSEEKRTVGEDKIASAVVIEKDVVQVLSDIKNVVNASDIIVTVNDSNNCTKGNSDNHGEEVTATDEICDQGEGSDNMEIDTDTLEVMSTPIRHQRVITGAVRLSYQTSRNLTAPLKNFTVMLTNYVLYTLFSLVISEYGRSLFLYSCDSDMKCLFSSIY